MSEEICGWNLRQLRTWITVDGRAKLSFDAIDNIWRVWPHFGPDINILYYTGLPYTHGRFALHEKLTQSLDMLEAIIGCDRQIKLEQPSGYILVGTASQHSSNPQQGLLLSKHSGLWQIYVHHDTQSCYQDAAEQLLGTGFTTRYALLEALSEFVVPPQHHQDRHGALV